jgi:hypothetical protein
MSNSIASFNLQLAWIWILLGFISGAIMGSFFHRETWLGGYGSLPRRMYRLGHISFFGLSIINLMFFVTVRELGLGGAAIVWASRGFVAGAITMPVCCGLMAHIPRARLLFAVPVVSLLGACVLTLVALATA